MRLADFNIAGMMAEELDGLDMSFERIKIPSAGSTVFEVPGENPGEPDTVKEVSAVILYHHPLHALQDQVHRRKPPARLRKLRRRNRRRRHGRELRHLPVV